MDAEKRRARAVFEHRCYVLDINDHAALAQAAHDFIQCAGGIDIVIANAGISAGTLTEIAEDLNTFQTIIQTNLVGLCATFSPFISTMQPQGIKVVSILSGYIDTPMTRKNAYFMPFLMPVDQFAMRAQQAIHVGTRYCVIPWQMSVIAKLLRALPNCIYDFIFVRAPRKAR